MNILPALKNKAHIFWEYSYNMRMRLIALSMLSGCGVPLMFALLISCSAIVKLALLTGPMVCSNAQQLALVSKMMGFSAQSGFFLIAPYYLIPISIAAALFVCIMMSREDDGSIQDIPKNFVKDNLICKLNRKESRIIRLMVRAFIALGVDATCPPVNINENAANSEPVPAPHCNYTSYAGISHGIQKCFAPVKPVCAALSSCMRLR